MEGVEWGRGMENGEWGVPIRMREGEGLATRSLICGVG